MNRKTKSIKLIAALTAVIIAGVAFCCSKKKPDAQVFYAPEPGQDSSMGTETETKTADPAEESWIWVYVCGAVQSPGVYSLPAGARVFEAIDLAGGLKDDAVSGSLNLASVLADGQKVFVPDHQDLVLQDDGSVAGDPAAGRLIDLNAATLSELMTLPGIGEVKAKAILDYRSEHVFRTIEDVMNVPGIKESAFQKIRDLITVS